MHTENSAFGGGRAIRVVSTADDLTTLPREITDTQRAHPSATMPKCCGAWELTEFFFGARPRAVPTADLSRNYRNNAHTLCVSCGAHAI